MTAADLAHRALVVGLAAGIGLLGGCGANGDDQAAADGPLSVTDVWARATPPGTTVGAVYLTVTSASGDALVGADVDPSIAAAATLHSTMTDGSGQTSMEGLAELDVPAGGRLVLEPSGHHIMLVDLTDPLGDGETFDLTLEFRAAGDLVVAVEVRDDAP